MTRLRLAYHACSDYRIGNPTWNHLVGGIYLRAVDHRLVDVIGIAVAQIVNMGLSIYFYIIIARAIISWVNPDPYNPIVRFLYQATEPVLYRIRKWIPYLGGIDLSPIIAMLVIKFLQFFVVETLIDLAVRMKAGGAL